MKASAAHLAQNLIADGALACNCVGVVVGRDEHHAVGNGSLDGVCLSVEYRTEKRERGFGNGGYGAELAQREGGNFPALPLHPHLILLRFVPIPLTP